jgi:hypothetical protein
MSILRVNSDITIVEGSRKVNGGYIMLQNKVVVVEFITGHRCEENHVISLSVVLTNVSPAKCFEQMAWKDL